MRTFAGAPTPAGRTSAEEESAIGGALVIAVGLAVNLVLVIVAARAN